MIKVIIISDDFSEVQFFQALFSKLGMDLQSVNSPKLLAEPLLSYNPNLLLISAKSTKFDGVKTCIDLKPAVRDKKVVVLYRSGEDMSELIAEIDGGLETPVVVGKLIDLLSALFSLDAEKLTSKLKASTKAKMDLRDKQAKDNASIYVGSVNNADSNGDLDASQSIRDKVQKKMASKSKGIRKSRYQSLVSSMEPIDTKKSFSSSRIRAFNKKLRDQFSQETLAELDGLKREFVKALYE